MISGMLRYGFLIFSTCLFQFTITSAWTFDKFKASIAEACDLAAVSESNLKVSNSYISNSKSEGLKIFVT
jgi:hypothetical protein